MDAAVRRHDARMNPAKNTEKKSNWATPVFNTTIGTPNSTAERRSVTWPRIRK
jgi:hypothetical protein